MRNAVKVDGRPVLDSENTKRLGFAYKVVGARDEVPSFTPTYEDD